MGKPEQRFPNSIGKIFRVGYVQNIDFFYPLSEINNMGISCVRRAALLNTAPTYRSKVRCSVLQLDPHQHPVESVFSIRHMWVVLVLCVSES